MKTKMIFAALLLAVAFATPAMAQHDYSGPWVGMNIGQGSGDGLKDAFNVENAKGKFVGFGAGYDWQRGNVVFGIVGNISGARINGERTVSTLYQSSDSDYTSRTTVDTKATLDRFYTLRGRLGYVAGPWLLYGTGGIASARVKTGRIYTDRYSYTDNGGNPHSGVDVSESKQMLNTTGWVFGVGAEYAINTNWRAKMEVLNLQVQDSYYARGVAQFRIIQAGVEYKF
ncbi:MAG: outer membrane beta-barrel protein [Candidatus Parcubacteria bacterium]|nr:outer membrane beta-barrel protein [Candidatus Parcubacteria bacterium]